MEKRIFSKLMNSMLFAVTFLTITACGDEEEPKVEDKFSTEYSFTAELSTDLVKTADVKVYVLSPDGIVSEESVTKEKNTWTFKGSSIPDKAAVMFEFYAKPNILEGDYQIGYKTTTTVKCLNNGDAFSYKTEDSEESFTVVADQISDVYDTSLTLAGEVNSNGEAHVTDGSKIDFGLNLGTHLPQLSRPQGGR